MKFNDMTFEIIRRNKMQQIGFKDGKFKDAAFWTIKTNSPRLSCIL